MCKILKAQHNLLMLKAEAGDEMLQGVFCFKGNLKKKAGVMLNQVHEILNVRSQQYF